MKECRIAEDAALLVELARRHHAGTYRCFADWPMEGVDFIGYRFTYKGARWLVQIGRKTWIISPVLYYQACERLQWLEYGYAL